MVWNLKIWVWVTCYAQCTWSNHLVPVWWCWFYDKLPSLLAPLKCCLKNPQIYDLFHTIQKLNLIFIITNNHTIINNYHDESWIIALLWTKRIKQTFDNYRLPLVNLWPTRHNFCNLDARNCQVICMILIIVVLPKSSVK